MATIYDGHSNAPDVHAPGHVVPSLPNVLAAYEARWVLPYFTALTPVLGIFSALIFGSLSDRKVDAGRLLGILGLSGAVFLWLSFSSLKWGWHPGWFLFFQACNALISAPMIPLITKVKLANLPDAEKSFPIYSMGGTLGWLCGSFLVSALAFDHSADAGRLATGIRVGMSFLCFFLPATPPTDRNSRGWAAALGLPAFRLLRDPELRRFYIASTLLFIPGVAHFMITPTMLTAFGSEHPTAEMGLGQATELGAMLFLSIVAGAFADALVPRLRDVAGGLSVRALRAGCRAGGPQRALDWHRPAWAGLHLHCRGRPHLSGQAGARHDAWASAGAAQFIGF